MWLPKCMREIGFDKIGFNILADTYNVCYAMCLKNWQLEKQSTDEKKKKIQIIKMFVFMLKNMLNNNYLAFHCSRIRP